MQKIRILHIVHSLNIGGLERVVINLAKGLLEKGHQPVICCLSEKGRLSEQAENSGVPVFALAKKDGIDPRIPFQLRSVIKAGVFDLIHTHNEAGLIYGALSALMAGQRKIVHTEHGKEAEYQDDKRLQQIEGFLLRRVRDVVLVSSQLREIMPAVRRLDQNRVHTIVNGIDADVYSIHRHRARMKIALGLKPDGFVIGHIARMIPLKNQQFLLSVFEELRKEFEGIQLVLVGDGPSRRELEERCIRAGMEQDVLFIGSRTDIPEVLSVMDLFLLTSTTEGISVTVLEAMAAGIPVIASRVGGNPEVIEDGKNGFLLELDGVQNWVAKAGELIVSPEERARISFNGKHSVRRNFSVKAMTESYERIYQSLF